MVEPASSAGAAMDYENWDYLGLLKERKESMLEDIRKIHETCPRDPGHVKGVNDCKICWRKIVDRIKQRYLENTKGEWYADRPIFIQHLTDLIALVRRGEKDLADIENRVMDEKRKWFREGVKRWAATMASFGLTEKREELLRLLDARKLEFKDFCEQVQRVIDVDIEACPPGSLQRLLNTRNNKADRSRAYLEIIFFPSGRPAVVSKSTQKYLDMLDQDASMKQILATMTEDRRQNLNRQAEVDEKKQRLEYIRNAKSIWEKERDAKKAKKRKAAAATAAAAAAAIEASRGPPCAVCKRPVSEGDDVAHCSICEISFHYEISAETRAWCSKRCREEDSYKHCAEQHSSCAAGNSCLQFHEDVEPEVLMPYFCKDCLEAGTSAAFWCTLKCAKIHYDDHRTHWHSDRGTRHSQMGTNSGTHTSVDEATRLISADEAMTDLTKKSTTRSNLSFDYALISQVEPDNDQPGLGSDAMEGVEMQEASSSGAPVREPVNRVAAGSVINGNQQTKELADSGKPEAANPDMEMRDAGASNDQPKDDSVYRWGDKAPRQKIDPATYKPREVESMRRRSNEPLLSKEMEDHYMYRRSAEPPVEPTSIFSKTGGNGTFKEHPNSTEPITAGTGNQRSQPASHTTPPKRPEEERSRPVAPTNNNNNYSRPDPAKDPRKFAPAIETQPPRYRNDEQRRYGDREYQRSEDFRKRTAAEARHFDRDRDFKRARSENSEEKEEGEI